MDRVDSVSTMRYCTDPRPPAAGAGLAALEGAHKVDGVAYTLLPLAGDLKIF